MVNWFGPEGFKATIVQNDVRPGGAYHFHILGPNYEANWRGIYREVIEPERLVFTWPNAASPPGQNDDTLVAVTFEDVNGKTRLTLRHGMFVSEALRDDHTRGWNSSLDCLADYLKVAHE